MSAAAVKCYSIRYIAIKKGHLSTLKLFAKELGEDIIILDRATYIAGKYRHHFLNYLFSIQPLYNAAMAGAAAAGNLELIQTMIKNGATDLNREL